MRMQTPKKTRNETRCPYTKLFRSLTNEDGVGGIRHEQQGCQYACALELRKLDGAAVEQHREAQGPRFVYAPYNAGVLNGAGDFHRAGRIGHQFFDGLGQARSHFVKAKMTVGRSEEHTV